MIPRVTWEQYIGPYVIATRLREDVGARKAGRIAERGGLLGESLDVGPYRVGLGLYNAKNPQANAWQQKVHGLLMIAMLGDEVVGVLNQRVLWIAEGHRGSRLGVEMAYGRAKARIARLPLDTGRPCIVDYSQRTLEQLRPTPLQWTPEGLRTVMHTYLLLVERGDLDPGDSELPSVDKLELEVGHKVRA